MGTRVHVYLRMYMTYMCIPMHILPSIAHWKDRRKKISVVTSTCSLHIIMSNTIPHWKQKGLLKEELDSRAGVNEAQNEPRVSCYTRKQEAAQEMTVDWHRDQGPGAKGSDWPSMWAPEWFKGQQYTLNHWEKTGTHGSASIHNRQREEGRALNSG